MVIGGPVIIVLADLVVYILVGKLGKRTTGKGTKYEPFAGGEEEAAPRGLYQSELFVFAGLFMVVEAFALLVAGSFLASSVYYPLLFLAGGSGVILIVTWWLILIGGGKF